MKNIKNITMYIYNNIQILGLYVLLNLPPMSIWFPACELTTSSERLSIWARVPIGNHYEQVEKYKIVILWCK